MSPWIARPLVFVSSAAVLMLEILAGRLLAPYVGVSVETFTGIIGTVLAAIALGAWFGGRLADRRPPAPLLGPLFMFAGILALLAPTFTTLFGSALRARGTEAVVLITLLAFFAPAAVLSAIAPLVVKLRLQSLTETGEVVGSLSAVGTVGALFGTFVTGFVLIATVPTRPIVLVIGLLLSAIGIALALWVRGGDSGSDRDPEHGSGSHPGAAARDIGQA
ncbi:MAG: fused MFS/spermidine synthase, partial [Acidimicrobiia bacterium]|nr:fused MFS/spermidine synthase [Acidimicrobiia bacterium]